MDNERTLRVLADHFEAIGNTREVLSDECRIWYYQRAADILTTKYIESALSWETYQMALSTLRMALGVPAPHPDNDRAD